MTAALEMQMRRELGRDLAEAARQLYDPLFSENGTFDLLGVIGEARVQRKVRYVSVVRSGRLNPP